MAERLSIAVCGAAGKMGQAVLRLALAQPGVEVVAALERPGHPWCGQVLGAVWPEAAGSKIRCTTWPELAAAPQVLIDFSAPPALPDNLQQCLRRGCAAVVGTTGLGPQEQQALRQAAGHIPCLWAANFSRGIPLLLQLLPQVARAWPEAVAAILEIHHRHKKDAPSGTAKVLAEALQGEGQTAPVQSLRGGDVFGEHTVHFLGEGERLELVHRASGREVFARGALAAARFLSGRPAGLYTIEQVYGIKDSSRR